MEVYRLSRREDGQLGPVQALLDFPQCHKTADVVGMGFASSGHFVMTCADDNTLLIWSIKGDVLHEVDTHQGSTYCAKVVRCSLPAKP